MNLITWWLGLPSSSSHALIGGLAGAGVTKAGFGAIVWKGLAITAAAIVLSPLLGFFLALLLVLAVLWAFVHSTPPAVDNFFRSAHLLSAALYSLGHGGNSAQKTMGIIAVLLYSQGLLGATFYIPFWVVLICQAAMGLGTLVGGWRIVRTMGSRLRGFSVQGTPQGLAVYMQGIRVNEAFGDTVNWDLIPKVAIGRSDIWTNNPAFGLNALGGAISFQMKDGFTYNGTEFDTSGGSYGRVGGSLQHGVRNGEWGLYLAAEGLKDDGWRYQSPSRLARFYGDLGWKGTDAEIHLVTSAADNYFGVIGPTPVELLANDYRAIYTWPQTTKNQAELIALNGR